MGLKDELTTYIHDTFRKPWSADEWDHVPTEGDKLGLGNSGVRIDATVLYVDLTDSTGLVKNNKDEFAAEVYKTFVYTAVKCIRGVRGSVTAYDGDRVMGVFMGNRMRNDATRAAFLIGAAVDDVVQPELDSMYPGKYNVSYKVGVDHSQLLVANTGIRGNNDYVWVGNAANNAAKMATLKRGYTTYITDDIHDYLGENLLKTGTGATIWNDLGTSDFGYKIWGASGRMVDIS